jgi:hypothetical protein
VQAAAVVVAGARDAIENRGSMESAERERAMTTLMFGALLGLSGYLGMRLHAAATENSALRANVAMLKRRLVERH